MRKPAASILAAALGLLIALSSAYEAPAQGTNRGPSGLPLPRFVSLKADKVNMRIGPGLDYAIAWRYTRADVPMEIIQEYDNWRKVRDAEGADGWIHGALLSGERTALAAPWMRDGGEGVFVMMYSEKQERGRLVAKLQPGVIVRVSACDGTWCEASVGGAEGWVPQQELWGVYPGEAFQ